MGKTMDYIKSLVEQVSTNGSKLRHMG